jgi:2-succinyl-5-enolpyruvyl-6-hydroxy-3-cyclohexene-1-carboxylate synthase
VNPATAFGTVFADELARCGLREVVLAPGSRSAPLAMAFFGLARGAQGAPGRLRLHVRIDERSAAFLALGLAKASRRPVAVLCTSGTAAASFHPAVIEADESGVPLLVLTADRPPELRGTGANQAIDQLKLYGGAVRWSCDVGVPEDRQGQAGYWRSLACRAWAHAAGAAGGFAGPVHLNLPLRDPLLPDPPAAGGAAYDAASGGLTVVSSGTPAAPSAVGAELESLAGRPGGTPWTTFAPLTPFATLQHPGAGTSMSHSCSSMNSAGTSMFYGALELPWQERGVVVCGDGDYDAAGLLALAGQAGWPVLAEPSSGARRGPNALRGYPYLLTSPEFAAAHRPDVIVSAGRPGLTRGQLALLRGAGTGGPRRHVVIAQGPGRWADPARTATDVVPAVRLAEPGPGPGGWLASWQQADAAAGRAVDEILDGLAEPSEPRLARDLAAALPNGALLWAASSLPARDLDQQMAPRDGLRVLASRGASGIDGLTSSAAGAALAHAAAGGGRAVALLGDLAFLHDSPGLVLGPDEPRPDLCLVVVNNDGGGIFSTLEQAAFDEPFERIFGTPHGAGIEHYARAAGTPYLRLGSARELPSALGLDCAPPPSLRIIEVKTSRAAQAALRRRLQAAAHQGIARA